MASQDAAGAYTPLFSLAQGGIGEVSLALRAEGEFRRLYAMKRLHARFSGDSAMQRMFLAEARVAGLLRHPNIVSVLDVGSDRAGPFLVMELVEGITVADLLRKHAGMQELIPLSVVLDVVLQAARGLDALHTLRALDGTAQMIVHRDVSPQNLLLGFDGVVRVTDFGIAKDLSGSHHTTTGVLRGKSGYMSPEQIRMETLSARSDLFSLGVVCWELICGVRLYGEDGERSPASRIMEEPPPDPLEYRADVSPMLSELVFDLLAKAPEDRPPDAHAVVERLGELLAETARHEELSTYLCEVFDEERQGFSARVREAVERSARPRPQARSKRRTLAFAGASALVVLGAAAVLPGSGHASPQKAPADAHVADAPRDPPPPEPESPADAPPSPIEGAASAEETFVDTPAEQVPAQVEDAPIRRRVRMRRRPRATSSPMGSLGDDTWWEP